METESRPTDTELLTTTKCRMDTDTRRNELTRIIASSSWVLAPKTTAQRTADGTLLQSRQAPGINRGLAVTGLFALQILRPPSFSFSFLLSSLCVLHQCFMAVDVAVCVYAREFFLPR